MKYGTPPPTSDFSASVLEKSKKEYEEVEDLRGSETIIDAATMQSSETVQKAINKANSDLKNYEENYTEEELSRKLKDDGYESLDQVKSIAR